MFPKCYRLLKDNDAQLGLVIAAGEESRSDTQLDMSPDFHSHCDDYDPDYQQGDEIRDYLHLNKDRLNIDADTVDTTGIAAADDSEDAAVPFH